MSKAINKDYLLRQFKNFDDEIIAEYYVDNGTFLNFASGVNSALSNKQDDLGMSVNNGELYSGEDQVISDETGQGIVDAIDRLISAGGIISGGSGGGGISGSMLTGTLSSSSWSNDTQTVSINGISSNSMGIIGLLDTASSAQIEAAKEAEINITSVSTNSISFSCKNTPSIDIPFGVLLIGNGGQ